MHCVREISPAINMSVDEWLAIMPDDLRQMVEEIRRQKQIGIRPSPSETLIDQSAIMNTASRRKLIDAVAGLVDENYAGRAEMCIQFSLLLHKALWYLRFPSRPISGVAIYYDAYSSEIYRWNHAWVRVGDEVIDGNVDCLSENPFVPKAVSVHPYWGPVTSVPKDRRLRPTQGEHLSSDTDVENIWWPELREWIDRELVKA